MSGEAVRKNSGLRKFIDQIRKLFRSHTENSDKLLYENTFVKFETSELKYSIPVNDDQITLELKKYSFSPQDKMPINFYIVAASFVTNSYYNAFLKLTFTSEEKAGRFYSKVAEFIKTNITPGTN